MSYTQIYNERLRDLLAPSSPELDLRDDSSGNATVCGAVTVNVTDASHVMSLLEVGNTRRTQEFTAANATSSRSHAILDVRVRQTSAVKLAQQRNTKEARLTMIDLAGSERAANTLNTGLRFVEGSHINKSLLALGSCINGLASKAKYTNFRDSKLTRMLKESLGGNCKTIMICHVSPASSQYEETHNTLTYANRAKNIATVVTVNKPSLKDQLTEVSVLR